MTNFSSRLYTILKSPRGVPLNLKPEAHECVKFANICRAASLQGKLNAVWFSVTNEFSGSKRPLFGALMNAMGRLAGCPDYIFLWKGGCGCIEMKSAKGILQPNQRVFKEWCETLGVPYVLCRSAEEARKVVEGWQLTQKN